MYGQSPPNRSQYHGQGSAVTYYITNKVVRRLWGEVVRHYGSRLLDIRWLVWIGGLGLICRRRRLGELPAAEQRVASLHPINVDLGEAGRGQPA
jgi:hypothetical protein